MNKNKANCLMTPEVFIALHQVLMHARTDYKHQLKAGAVDVDEHIWLSIKKVLRWIGKEPALAAMDKELAG